MADELTDKQVENWRKILSATIGPYAFIMPIEEIQKIKDNFQETLSKEGYNE